MMDSTHKQDDPEIYNLCKDVIGLSKKPDCREFSNSIDVLRRVCGRHECGCGSLIPHQCLRLLLRLPLDKCELDGALGLALLSNHGSVSVEPRCQATLQQVTMLSLSDHSAENKPFLDRVWNFEGVKNFTTDVVDDLIQFYKDKIEDDMFKLFCKSVKTSSPLEVVWKDMGLERFVLWSSKSAKTFNAVSSLLHACLLRVTGVVGSHVRCIGLVQTFVDMVKVQCNKNKQDFVLLYPYEYHSLVSLLDIPPEVFPEKPESKGSVCLTSVVEMVRQSLENKPVQTCCLLTHFPKWAPYIIK